MARMTRRVISDELWQRIEPHLPAHSEHPSGGRPWVNDRECLEGIVWVLRTGARWRDVPLDLPSGSTCWRRLQLWAGEGILDLIQEKLFHELRRLGKFDLRQLVGDATFIRAKKGATTLAIPSAARG
jgi:transposase